MVVGAEFFVAALAISSISLTITRSKVALSLREKALEMNKMLGHLLGCPYCLSHWIALPILPVIPFTGFYEGFVMLFGVIGAAALVTAVLTNFLFKQENEVEYLRDELGEMAELVTRFSEGKSQ